MRVPSAAAFCAVSVNLLVACPSPRPAPTRDAPSDSVASSGVVPTTTGTPPSPAPSASRQRVRLVAKHPLGVPLHPAERAQEVSGRLPDGSEVSVVQRSADGRWLQVVANDGSRGWITVRYAPTLVAQQPRETVELDEDSEFHSRQACERLVSTRRAARDPRRARIMSYNVRRFPDGAAGDDTDIEWLACVVASSNADLVAVQEFKNEKQAKPALDQLLARLDTLTRGRWQAGFDDCPGALHVGVLYDASRVQAMSLGTFASLNPHGEACKDQLRPGFGGYFRFPGGFDAHLVSVHLKSAATRRALELRRKSLAGLGAAAARALAAHRDDDIIFAGDLNSMGCTKCSPRLESAAEIAEIDDLLGKTRPAFRRVAARPSCSHYFRGEGTLLDHFIVSKNMRELAADETSNVSGYCGVLRCEPLRRRQEPSAYHRLSDHCPVLLSFDDRDED